MKIKKNIQSMYQKNVAKKNTFIYYKQEKKERGTMFLSKILTLSCMIIHYIVEESNFVVNVYKLLVQKIY